jgi:hypothetical protein
MLDSLPFDWFILLLRALFIFLLYFFLFQVMRVTSRELMALATVTSEPTEAGASRPNGRMVVVDPAQSELTPGLAFSLTTRSLVGRLRECDIILDDPFVSAEHAEVTFESNRWWVRDLGSTNGTFINGAVVTVPAGIKLGDVVQFGRVKLQLTQ